MVGIWVIWIDFCVFYGVFDFEKNMTDTRQLLSELVIHNKYAKYVDGRRERWDEIVERTFAMHRRHFWHHKEIISDLDVAEDLVKNKYIMPSMRSLQFAGDPIENHNERMYNCSFLPILSLLDFKDLFSLCMVGVGVGFSIYKNQPINKPNMYEKKTVVVGDSIEGWSNALKELLNSYIESNAPKVVFDYSEIRPKGALIKSIGAHAPGYKPLEWGLEKIREILERKKNEGFLRTIDLFDIGTILGDVATCGGTRRSALISFFLPDDTEMMNAKGDGFWEKYPWRSRANISCTFDRNKYSRDEIKTFLNKNITSLTGEPGIFLTNNIYWGTNPCAEIALAPYSFCNLSSVNATTCNIDPALFTLCCNMAALLGTLQTCYDNFTLVNKNFYINTREERLLGVSLTGIANVDEKYLPFIKKGATSCSEENKRYSKMLGIKSAARVTCIKPEGSTSLVMGTSSGVHPEESPFYMRNIRIDKKRGVINYLKEKNYPFLEEDYYSQDDYCVGIPIKAQGVTYQNFNSEKQLDLIFRLNKDWINPGHFDGENKHNVSTTLRINAENADSIVHKLASNIDLFSAVAYLPDSDAVYPQAPYQRITEEEYNNALNKLPENIKMNDIVETFTDNDFLKHSACEGNLCGLTRD